MRSSCSSEFYRCHRIEPIGLARSRHDLAVSNRVFAVFLAPPAPAFLRLRVHPLVGLLPLQSTSQVFICAPLSLCAPSLGFPVSPSRHQCFESTNSRRPMSCLRSALSVSHALDGLLLLAPCGLVSSHCHVRDSLLRGFPQQPVVRAFTRPCPHVVFAFRLPGSKLPGANSRPSPSGLHSSCRSVVVVGWIRPSDPRSPLEFSLPQVFVRTPW
jgi:hypothetical protein